MDLILYLSNTYSIENLDLLYSLTKFLKDNNLSLNDLITLTPENKSNLRAKKITGKQFDQALESIGITVNKNTIPNDPESPFITSGVRIGLTAVSERGFGHDEITEVADIMEKVADNIDNEKVLKECKKQARNLISKFPLYPEGYNIPFL